MRVAIASLLLAFLCGKEAIANSFEYANPFYENHTFSIQTQQKTLTSGDRAVDAEFCAKSEPFICIGSEWFSFSVPISGAAAPTEWSKFGHRYVLKNRREISMLGTLIDVCEIESIQSAQTFKFLYSKSKGLVAFNVEVDGKPVTFVTKGKVGFGSQKTGGSRSRSCL